MEQKIEQIAVEDIIPNRFQPRLAFDDEGLKELSDSIKQHGIIQPLVLRRLGNKYEIIAGERRFKASMMAGLKTVPAIISNIDDNKSAEIALVENIQRRNLTAIEEAKSYKNLLDRGYMTQEQLAQKMGVSQSTIANKLRLLNLAPEVQDALLQEKISERHARSLLQVPIEEQPNWLRKIITKRMTVRQLDLEIKKLKDQDQSTDSSPVLTPDINPEVINGEPNPLDSNEIETKESTNKFFNFLENEGTNMNFNSVNEPLNQSMEQIEELGDIDLLEENQPVEDAQPKDSEPIVPLFQSAETPNNKIEEIVSNEEEIIDPLDSIAKLDPNYEEEQKELAKLDLKTAINDVRDFVKALQDKGFDVNIDEIDLEQTYQMTINIKK